MATHDKGFGISQNMASVTLIKDKQTEGQVKES